MRSVIQSSKWLALTFTLLLLASCSTLPSIDFFHKEKDSAYFRGVYHVHSNHSHDSSGSVQRIIRAANKLDLDFVIITDHNNLNILSEINALNHRDSPLLIVGNEISTADGHLVTLGTPYVVETPVEPQKAIDLIRERNGYTILAHPVCARTAWSNWAVKNFDGIEVYNYACDFYQSNKFAFFLKSLLLLPDSFVKQTILKPESALQKWDSITRNQITPAFAAADAHEQYGFGRFHLIRYDISFRSATLYIPKTSFDERTILKALFSGESFIVFESFGRPKQFTFSAQTAHARYFMGNSADIEGPVTFNIKLDRSAKIRLLRNGEVIRQSTGRSLTFDTRLPGNYRAEIYQGERLWIISNPILIHAAN